MRFQRGVSDDGEMAVERHSGIVGAQRMGDAPLDCCYGRGGASMSRIYEWLAGEPTPGLFRDDGSLAGQREALAIGAAGAGGRAWVRGRGERAHGCTRKKGLLPKEESRQLRLSRIPRIALAACGPRANARRRIITSRQATCFIPPRPMPPKTNKKTHKAHQGIHDGC